MVRDWFAAEPCSSAQETVRAVSALTTVNATLI